MGRGVAYSTPDICHVLNVPAGQMSLFEDRPDDFVDWLLKYGSRQDFQSWGLSESQDLSHCFVPRMWYGRYLSSRLKREVHEAAKHGNEVEMIVGKVEQIVHDSRSFNVTLKSRQTLSYDALVLAMGNHRPQTLPGISADIDEDPHYIGNPWDTRRLKQIDPRASVLIVGTGLTMVDCVLSLQAKNRSGRIFALSRSGVLPCSHGTSLIPFTFPEPQKLPKDVRALLRLVRMEMNNLEVRGGSWHGVMNAFRSITSSLWQELSIEEQRRFLRHVKPYWEIHRHRLPALCHTITKELREQGLLSVLAGRVRDIARKSQKFQVDVVLRERASMGTLSVDYVINATGPINDFRKSDVPLIQSLIESHLMIPHPLGLGILVDVNSHVVGAPQGLYAVGALTKGRFWEITAIPDIRRQAEDLAIKLTRPKIEDHVPR